MTNVHLETRPTPRIPRPAPAHSYSTTTPGKASWWLAGVVAIVAISAVAVLVINQNDAQTTAAFHQGAAIATTTDETGVAQKAAVQANASADAANASAIQAENQTALLAQRGEDNPAAQPKTPSASTTSSAPGVTSPASR